MKNFKLEIKRLKNFRKENMKLRKGSSKYKNWNLKIIIKND